MSYQSSDVGLDSHYSKSFDDAGRSSNQSLSYVSYTRDEDDTSYFEQTETGIPLEDDVSQLDDGVSQLEDGVSQLEEDRIAEQEEDNVSQLDNESELEKVPSSQLEESSVEKVPSDNGSQPPEEEKEEEEVDPTADIPVTIKDNMKYMSTAQIKAARYLQKKRIFEFFNFLLGHLLSATPTNPIVFLDNLLDKCIAYRDGTEEDVEPPLVFTPLHIEMLYKAFDPLGFGSISMDQYKTAMMTMGINDYNENPSQEDMEKVSQVTFCTEAERCLTIMLKEMLQVHRECSMPTLPVVTEPNDADDASGALYDEDGNLIAPTGSEENSNVVMSPDYPVEEEATPSYVEPFGGSVGSANGSFAVAAPDVDTYDPITGQGFVPEEEGYLAPEEEGEAAPEEQEGPAPEEWGDPAPAEWGDPASEEQGDSAPEQQGDAAPEEQGDPASEEQGDAAPEEQGDPPLDQS